MQIWAESGKSALPICNYSQILYQFLTFTQNLRRSHYIFSYILNSYGSIAGIVVVAVLAALVMFIFGASIKQKNELGMVMGFGCGMIILLNILLNLLGALGIIPPASSFLPFLSIGRSNILLCYALVGIIMSIYRYKDVYPKKIRASQVSFQKTINI